MSAQSRRRTLRAVAPVAGLLAAGLLVWQGSYAAFSATTNNKTDSWAAGSVKLDNSTDGGTSFAGSTTAVFTATALKPGDNGNRCITVRSNGNLAGAVKLYAQNESTTKALDAWLTVKVEVQTGVGATTVPTNCTGFAATSTPLAGAHLKDLPTSYGGSTIGGWNPTGTSPEYATYRITWTLDNAAPDTVQGGTAQTDFVWEIQS